MSLRAHKLCPYPLGSILIIRSFCKHQDSSKPPFTFSFTLSLLLFFHFSFLYFCGCLSSQIYLPSTLTLYHHCFPFCPHSLSSLHSQVHSCSFLLHCPLSYPLTASSLTAQGSGGFLTTLWGRQCRRYSCCIDEKPGIFRGHVAGRTRMRIHVWERVNTLLWKGMSLKSGPSTGRVSVLFFLNYISFLLERYKWRVYIHLWGLETDF